MATLWNFDNEECHQCMLDVVLQLTLLRKSIIFKHLAIFCCFLLCLSSFSHKRHILLFLIFLLQLLNTCVNVISCHGRIWICHSLYMRLLVYYFLEHLASSLYIFSGVERCIERYIYSFLSTLFLPWDITLS